jgi:hypothetical protein
VVAAIAGAVAFTAVFVFTSRPAGDPDAPLGDGPAVVAGGGGAVTITPVAPTVTGTAAPGGPVPAIAGQTFTGRPLAVDAASGRPKVVVTVHPDCDGCADVVRAVRDWVLANNLPAGVELIVAVDVNGDASATRAWLESLGLPAEALADDGSVATALGGQPGTPAAIAVNAGGVVVGQETGAITGAQLTGLATRARTAS